MRTAHVVPLCWLAATFAGCGPREPMVDQAVVIPGTDTVVATAAATTDTAAPRRPWTPPPDDCRYTDARPRPKEGEPGYWEPYDSVALARGVEYRCSLRPSGPEVRLVVRGEWTVPMVVDVHSPPEAARPLQRLELDNEERAREGSDLVEGEDLNGDGWTDLRVRTFSGQGGVMYDVFLYAPVQRAFVRDTVLSRGGNVRRLAGQPCAQTSWKMGLGHWSLGTECWKDGRWILTQTVEQEPDDGPHRRWFRTHRGLRGDSLQIIRIDTLASPNQGLSP
jgi:hypothetical protein